MGSTNKSLTPGVPSSAAFTFSDTAAMVSRFWPNTLMPTSVRIPVASILMRLMMGCVQPFTTPGICNFASSSVTMSFLVMPSRHSLFGFSVMMVSIMLMGELSVAVLARPAFPKTLSTSGTDLIILSCTCKIRFASALDTSGSVTGINKILCSSNGGINSVPKFLSKGIVINNAITLIAIVVFLHFNTVLITGS
ncbi:hypothetical protein D3C86_1185090 [compost metagenome]